MIEKCKRWLYSRYVFLFVSKGPLRTRRIVRQSAGEKVSEKCNCDAFKKALESGSDNEGYAELFIYFEGAWTLGDGLPTPVFCPWCGKPLPEPSQSDTKVATAD